METMKNLKIGDKVLFNDTQYAIIEYIEEFEGNKKIWMCGSWHPYNHILELNK